MKNPRRSLAYLLVMLSVAMFALAFTSATSRAFAQDEAHGGPGDTATKPQAKPGEAVAAPRVTERWTEAGLTQNPVAIDFDGQGNLYIAEGWRAGISVIDNRNQGLRKSDGVINDLKKTSVEDRLAQIKMLEEGGFYPKGTFTKSADKVRFVRDTDGDGKADTSSIFADGFDDPLDGIASGVLFHNGKVYLTNIPHLWLLEDKDGDGDADKDTEGERVSLSYGYGIRWAFYGHDMHGLIKGPDGRIYWSIGDRGYNVKTKEGKHLYGPDRGAVFRMWPDGSGLELYFEGLRNPQELAFDNYGNLFTGDNNSDSGDKARFIYLPEGGDSGWRQDVQSLRDRGPWNREHMWKPRDTEKFGLVQPAWIIPPLKNVGRGPSGLAHYPGTGDVFASNGSFLMCDYPAGVRHIQLEPDGAGFKVAEDSSFVNGGTITDVAWGYDGRLYLSDWGGGWKPNPNGYIKTMTNKAAHAEQAKQIAEVKSLFAEGLKNSFTSTTGGIDLQGFIELLRHNDQRVRLAAQYEIAKESAYIPLMWTRCFSEDSSELMRLHAVWTLAMYARKNAVVVEWFIEAMSDSIANVRAQAVSSAGDLGLMVVDECIKLLVDESPVVRHHAAIALGKIGDKNAIAPLLDLLDRNNNKDVYIRHAASYGLSLIGDAEAIHKQAKGRGAGARLGAVLALRRLDSPLLAEYLDDDDAITAAEAARAICDKRVMEGMPALAALADTLPVERMTEPVMLRVVEANVRLADAESVSRLANLAANSTAPNMWRELALKELGAWSAERSREGVWGAWWPRGEQPMEPAIAAVEGALPQILETSNREIGDMARAIVLSKATPDQLESIALNPEESAGLRAVAVKVLKDKNKGSALQAAKAIVADPTAPAELLIPVRSLLVGMDKPAGLTSYLAAVESGTLEEKQDAVAQLVKIDDQQAKDRLAELGKQLKDGTLAPELRLDVYEAVAGNKKLSLSAQAAATEYKTSQLQAGEEPFIRDAVLVGGSIERGKDVFFNHPAAECSRCHTVGGVGPDLAGIATLHDGAYLYRAVVKPSSDIAQGYAKTTVKLKDGSTLTGQVIEGGPGSSKIVLMDNDGKKTKITRDAIDGEPIVSDQSAMTVMTDKLSAKELRDVLAYLGSLTGEPGHQHKHGGHGHGASHAGPKIINPAKDIRHGLVLPLILGGILLALVVLTGVTMLGAKPS